MGCDIHAMMESKKGTWWRNEGDPDIGRNYMVFSVLANVRNSYDIKPISLPKGLPGKKPDEPYDENDWLDASSEMNAFYHHWDSDAHSGSFITLKELKEYDINKNEDYNVGIFRRDFDDIIVQLEGVKERRGLNDDEVRIVFFFDN